MLSLLIFVPVIPLAITAVVIALVVSLTSSSRTRPQTPEARRASVSSGTALAVSVVAAISAAGWLITTGEYGRGVLLSGPVFVLVIQAGIAAATMIISTSIRSRGETRTATLGTRRASDGAPRLLTITTAVGATIAFTIMAVASSVAVLDSGTGEYRAFTYLRSDDARSTFSPFAGSFYSAPLAITLAVSAIIAAATLVGAQRWGALDQPEYDVTLRLGVSVRTVAATAMTTALILMIVGASLCQAAFRMAGSPEDTAWWTVARIALPIVPVLGLVLGAWSFFAFLSPTLGRKARP